MSIKEWKYIKIIKKLKNKGVTFAEGMTQNEILECEDFYSIKFPMPVKEMYSIALPVSKGFYNWKDYSEKSIERNKAAVSQPLEGILFDIENNDFWYDKWGKKPDTISEAKRVCIEEFQKVPKLFPVYGHRYMPLVEGKTNLPVYSVYQTDIIYYGEDLISYLKIEFGYKPHKSTKLSNILHVDFWDDIVDL